ncbi:MAG: MFS transporter [Pseudomonadales bacterium]|nr:MFS transporter [Pseudomonadales bacterium]
MSNNLTFHHSWRQSLAVFMQPKVWVMLLLGFSAGLPIMLIFSSLSIWLLEAGIQKSEVTYFSWAALGYSFKFVWAPLVDRVPIPWLTRLLGPRRSWMLLAQCCIVAAIVMMALTDPAQGASAVLVMAVAAVLLGFSSATQDIVIDAYRIEAADADMQAMMSATYIAGYRLGMIVTGAGALYLAAYFGTTREHYVYEAWRLTHLIIPVFMLVGMVTVLCIREPLAAKRGYDQFTHFDYVSLCLLFVVAAAGVVGVFFLSGDAITQLKGALPGTYSHSLLLAFSLEASRFSLAVAAAYAIARVMVKIGFANRQLVDVSYIAPIRNFLESHGAKTTVILLCLVSLFRISDVVLGVISNIFYTETGFSKEEIATAVKLFGVWMTILGGLVGGVFTMRFGVMAMLAFSAVLVVLTNLCFILLAHTGHNIYVLYGVVSADNLAAGIASASFIAFLSALVNVRFTAMQYAIFSSLMTLIPKLTAGYSGSIVEAVGYIPFFIITGLLGVPVLFFIYLAAKRLDIAHPAGNTEPS